MRTSRIVLLVIGVVVLAVAAVWRPVVAPQLTKLPTSLDIKYHFSGTYTGYVNQFTGARQNDLRHPFGHEAVPLAGAHLRRARAVRR